MEPELIFTLILGIVIVGSLIGWLWSRKKKGDFDIGKRMRMRNDERRATVIAK